MKKLVLKLINFYQTKISPSQDKRCRYFPSCSEYAKTAFETRNFFIAAFLTIKRLLKCNPLFKGGYDPVPLSKKMKLELELKNNIEDINNNINNIDNNQNKQ